MSKKTIKKLEHRKEMDGENRVELIWLSGYNKDAVGGKTWFKVYNETKYSGGFKKMENGLLKSEIYSRDESKFVFEGVKDKPVGESFKMDFVKEKAVFS